MKTQSNFESNPNSAAFSAGSPAGPSLKARAIGYLSRREHSRHELQRKLQPYAQSPEEIDNLLNSLEHDKWLCNKRFAQALVNRRASRYGWQRIVYELRQHNISETIIAELEAELPGSEHDRVFEVWQKKFRHKPENNKDFARQYRFLMSRGFSSAAIRHILGDLPE